MSILSNLTVRQQLILTFVFVTLGFVIGTGVGDAVSARMYQQADRIYENALVPINASGEVMRGIHDARAQLLLGLQHDPAGEWSKLHDHPLDRHTENYRHAVDVARQALAVYARRTGLPEDERRMLEEIGAGLDAYDAAGKEVLEGFKGGDFHLATTVILKKVNPAIAGLDKKVQDLEAALTRRAKEQNEESARLRLQLSVLMWGFAAAGLVMLWGNYWFLSSRIAKPLARVKEAIGRVAQGDLTTRIDAPGNNEFDSVLRSVARMQDSLRELMAAIQSSAQVTSNNARLLSAQIDETARRSQTQSDRIVEITTTLEEMSRTIEEVSGGAEGVDRASQQARSLAQASAANMDENLQTVDRIVATVRDSSGSIQDLCDSMHRISELAQIIKDIAGQTNLLALNAAIEAARAGEQGRGFAVVADEVRKLAEKTASSSANIGQLLETVGSRSDQAVTAMRQVMADVERGAGQTRAIGETLRRILDAASQVSDLTGTIAAASRQQSEASQQTVESMNTISSLTDGNNAAIQNVAVAASEMSDVASRLQELAGRFRFAA